MNKAVVVGGVVVLVAAGYGGATAWAGRQTQIQYQAWMTKTEARFPFLQVTDRQYKRGFFKAVSTTTFALGCPSADGKPTPSVTVTNTIHHGPIAGSTLAAAVVDSQVSFGGDAGEKVQAMFGGSPVTAHTVMSFGGAFKSTVGSPAAKVTLSDGTEVAWLGLSGTVDGAGHAGAISYRLASPGVTVDNATAGLHMKMSGLALDADNKTSPGANAIPAGTAHGSLDAFEVTGPMPSGAGATRPFTMSLTAMKFSNDTSIDADLISSSATLTGAGAFGDARFENFTLQGSMKRIHAPTYQHLMDGFSSANRRCGSAASADPTAVLQKSQGDLQTLLRYNPEVSIDKLAFDHAGQHGELSYSLGVQGVTASDAQMPLPMMLMSHGQAKASISLPVAWIRQLSQAGSARMQGAVPDPAVVDMMIDKVVDEGFVVRDGEFVKTNAEYANGKVMVNGHEIPLGGPMRR